MNEVATVFGGAIAAIGLGFILALLTHYIRRPLASKLLMGVAYVLEVGGLLLALFGFAILGAS